MDKAANVSRYLNSLVFHYLQLFAPFQNAAFQFPTQRCVVVSLKLWEGKESINAHFESPLKKGIQDLKAGVLAL